MEIQNIPIDNIFIDDEFNCRGRMAPIDVQELAKDIEKQGLLQPVVLMLHTAEETVKTGKMYKLVAGFRRTYAHIILKRETVPSVVKEHMTASEALTVNLAENLIRKDLNILQEAKAISRLINAGVVQEEVARQVGMSRGWVQARINLLRLPEQIQEDAANGLVNQYQIAVLAKMRSAEKQFEAVRKIKTARERGEKTNHLLKGRKIITANVKIRRKPPEIQMMVDLIMGKVGSNLATRALAWCNGNISDNDLFFSLKAADPKFEPPSIDMSGNYR